MINDLLNELVEDVVSKKNLDDKYLKSKGNANGFEDLFRDKIMQAFNKRHSNDPNQIHLKGNFGHIFPDIDLTIGNEIYGIELKSRKDGSWTTQGGSVFETTSQNPYKEIYVFFGSFNAKEGETSYKARWAPYWQVADAIKVTHSPRFHIDLDSNTPVFASNTMYKDFRKKDKKEQIKIVQYILAKNASKPEWYTDPKDNPDTITPNMYSELDENIKESIYIESLLLFPRDLLKPRSNYNNITQYWLSEYFVITPNMRDNFTAHGQSTFNNVKFPHILGEYQKYHEQIIQLIKSGNPQLIRQAYKFWQIKKPSSNPLIDFKKIIDQIGDQYYKNDLNKAGYQHLSDLMF